MKFEVGSALQLAGGPRERGRAQAALRGDLVATVRAEADRRRAELAPALERSRVRDYLQRQRAFAEEHCAPELAELDGIAEGFGLDARELFDGLHGSAALGIAHAEGCSAWAAAGDDGALLAKNRDIRADRWPLQDVMLHVDEAHAMRAVLCVGSIGAPGAYSSGINRAGLAVADTAIAAPSYATGWLRYFAMTRVLWECATVEAALDFLARVPHTGGGSLVIADRHGAVAAVEFPDGSPRIERAAVVARTNHFVAPGARNAAAPGDPNAANSAVRLDFLRSALAADRGPSTTTAAALMSAHAPAGAALCRHGAGEQVRTVSSAVYATGTGELLYSPDYPCLGRWRLYSVAAYDE